MPSPIYICVGRVAIEKNIKAFLDIKIEGSKIVVIDGGAEKIGTHVSGTVSNILQTAGGKIVFAKIDPPLSGSTESMAAKAINQPRDPQSGATFQPPNTDPTRRSTPPSARNPRRG